MKAQVRGARPPEWSMLGPPAISALASVAIKEHTNPIQIHKSILVDLLSVWIRASIATYVSCLVNNSNYSLVSTRVI
jgi:hypothetical protein